MRPSHKSSGFFIFVILAAAAATYFSLVQFSPGLNASLHKAIGVNMAQLALKFLKPGASLFIITRDTAAFKQPAFEQQFAGFQKAIKQAHAPVGGIQYIQTDPLRPVQVPPGDFFELIRKSPEGSVVVSFVGPPKFDEEKRKRLGQVKPSIVAFCSGNSPEQDNLAKLFDEGLLHGAVVSKMDLKIPSTAGRTLESFDDLYVAVTSGNLVNLPTPAEPTP